MSSVSSTGGTSVAALSAMQKERFNKVDADKNGTLTEQEFVAAKPKGATDAQASAVYKSLDTEGSGALTEEQFSKGRPSQPPEGQISGDAMAVLVGLQQGGQMGGQMGSQMGGQPGGPIGPPQGGLQSSEDLFTAIDADGDGKATEAEFLAAKPEDVTDEQASAMFKSLDTESTGYVTEEQLNSTMQAGRGQPPMGPPPGGFGQQSSTTATTTTTITDTSTTTV